MAGPLRGGGGKGPGHWGKKELFLGLFFQPTDVSTAIKHEGGGGLGLNGPTIKGRTFFAASLSKKYLNLFLLIDIQPLS